MSKTYTVSLPVKPYILKYVQTVEGSTIEFKGSSMLCQIIRAFITNKKSTGLSKERLKTSVNSRTASIQILVPVKYMNIIGLELSHDGIVLINRFLEECCFERALVKFMNENTKKNGRYKGFTEAYYAFARLYNIELEEDITFDGLKQMDFRLRKKKEKNDNKNGPNFFSALVPSF